MKILLEGLQHRGHDSAGMTLINTKRRLTGIKRVGEVNEVFHRDWIYQPRDHIELMAVGHVRYPTFGDAMAGEEENLLICDKPEDDSEDEMVNAQPFYYEIKGYEGYALVHNGNVYNADKLKDVLQGKNIHFIGESDSEVILMILIYLIKQKGSSPVQAIKEAMRILQGSFSCIFLTPEATYAFRDKFGNRPLEIAETDDLWIIASESCSWHKLQAKYVRSVEPGEIVEFKANSKE